MACSTEWLEKKPLLRDVNRVKTMQKKKYEKANLTDPTFWERVMFIDECKFYIFRGEGLTKVCRKSNAFDPKNIVSAIKHGRGSNSDGMGLHGSKWRWYATVQ